MLRIPEDKMAQSGQEHMTYLNITPLIGRVTIVGSLDIDLVSFYKKTVAVLRDRNHPGQALLKTQYHES
jgi:hypothetical protein